METKQCRTEDDCPTPMWCRGKDRCPQAEDKDDDRLGATACSALAEKWGKQADMLLTQKKDFVDRGYSSSLIQLWDTVAGVLNDCRKELEEAISSQNAKSPDAGATE